MKNESYIEGRNAVLEALRAGKPVDRLLILEGAHDHTLSSILREAKKHPETKVQFVKKERLDELSESGKHQGVAAFSAAYEYATVEDMLEKAAGQGEPPFLLLLDGIEDPTTSARSSGRQISRGRTVLSSVRTGRSD